MTLLGDVTAAIGLPAATADRQLAGGCIHDVRRVTCGPDVEIVCKVAGGPDGVAMLEAERAGLAALLETGTVQVPGVLGLVRSGDDTVLVLEYLPPDPGAHWGDGGRALARLHAHDSGQRYGWATDSWLGATPVPGGWYDNWCTCLGEGRLRPLAARARDSGVLDSSETGRIDRFIERLEGLIPADPGPSLLHGDLWSGNLHATAGTVALLDPACLVGDAWADPAMAMLFGGVPAAYLDAWRADRHDDVQVEERIACVQAMHLLNHVCLFGRGYLPGLQRVLDGLGSS